MRKEFLFLMALILGCSSLVFGQQEDTGYEIGVFAGYDNWKSRDFQIGPPQAATPIPLTFSYKDQPVYGVRGNFLSKGHWGGELSYTYQTNTVTLSRQGFTPVELAGSVHHIFYNQIFYPARYKGKAIPFITGGLGVAAYHLSDDARERAANPADFGLGSLKETDPRVALNYGGGVKVNVTQSVGIRFDARHIVSDVPSYGLPKQSTNPAAAVLPIGGKLQTFEFSVGIFYRKLSEGFK